MAKTKKHTIKGVFRGEWFTLSTYKKHIMEVVVVVTIILVYITFKFDVQMKLREIIELRKELTNVRANMINVSSEYNSRTREMEMQQLADTMKLNLKVPEQPPYNLDRINDNN